MVTIEIVAYTNEDTYLSVRYKEYLALHDITYPVKNYSKNWVVSDIGDNGYFINSKSLSALKDWQNLAEYVKFYYSNLHIESRVDTITLKEE